MEVYSFMLVDSTYFVDFEDLFIDDFELMVMEGPSAQSRFFSVCFYFFQ